MEYIDVTGDRCWCEDWALMQISFNSGGAETKYLLNSEGKNYTAKCNINLESEEKAILTYNLYRYEGKEIWTKKEYMIK